MSDLNTTKKSKLWVAGKPPPRAYRLQSGYKQVPHMEFLVEVDNLDRKTKRLSIAFPDAGVAYIIQDASQLKNIIERLQDIHIQLTGRGQANVLPYQKS